MMNSKNNLLIVCKVWLAIKSFFARVQKILLRYSEQQERAKQLLEQTKKDGKTSIQSTKVGVWLTALLFT